MADSTTTAASSCPHGYMTNDSRDPRSICPECSPQLRGILLPPEPCPHCAAKDAEIAALRERVGRAEAALTEIAGLDYTHAATNGMGHTAVILAQRILRGEK